METREYKIMEEAQEGHWWWLGRERLVERLIRTYCSAPRPLRIADVGSGLGANIPMLLRYGDVTALEPSAEAVAKVAEKWAATGRVRALRWNSPAPVDDRFDLVLLADVLEHIRDDVAAVEWIRHHLKPGGYAILTVPAHPHLWTEMDDVVHHYRRYRAGDLRRLLAPKLIVRRLTFYNLILYPVKLLFVAFAKGRRILRPGSPKRSFNEKPPRMINRIFASILSIEARLIGRLSLPFGVSMVVVAQKAATST
jgi:SAM-dependent methyltransferase